MKSDHRVCGQRVIRLAKEEGSTTPSRARQGRGIRLAKGLKEELLGPTDAKLCIVQAAWVYPESTGIQKQFANIL